MPAGLRPDAVRGYTPPRGQKADVEAYQSEIRPGFTGAHPYQNGREPPCFHPSRAGFHPQPDVFRRFPRPFRLPAQLGKEMEGSKAPVRHPEEKRMGSGRAEAYLRLLPPGPFLQSKPSPEGDGTLLPSLLLARYLNMEGITSATGAMFWTHSFVSPAPLKED